MESTKFKEQVEIIRQAFGYINRFKNETFVIKIDSSLIGHPYFPVLMKDIVLLHRMGIRIVLVPGAKSRIDEILTTYGIDCDAVNGVRISPPEAIPFIKMAAFDVSNKIMTILAENNTNAIIGNWVKARSIGIRNGVDYQSSGIVEKLQTATITNMLGQGMIPIFPNIGWSAKGKPYNISSNELALTISRELKAAKLFFITSFGAIASDSYTVAEGVYVSSEGNISQMTIDEAGAFLDHNTSEHYDPALELVSIAYKACVGGVRRVHVLDGRVEGMLLKEIFSNRGFGTMIYANQLENIRPAKHNDISELLRVMTPSVEEGILVQRTAAQIEDKLEDYVAYEVDGTIHGCGALHAFAGKKGEIAAIAVDSAYASLGIGKKIITYLIERAT
ncbi:MAG: amino-acid N-acetyltransferase, partial [Chitinivibrionales bacterium]